MKDRSSINPDTALRALAHETRRAAVRHLSNAGTGPVQVADLADALTDDERRTVALNLHHRHLPKLAEAGTVKWEHGDESVRYQPVGIIEDVLVVLEEAVD